MSTKPRALALFALLMTIACGDDASDFSVDRGDPGAADATGDPGAGETTDGAASARDVAGADDTASVDDGAKADSGAPGDGSAQDRGAPPEDTRSGFEYECEPGNYRRCDATCGTEGLQQCLKEWGPCVPPVEVCDNCVDDDCDGTVNEGCLPNPDCEDPPPDPGCPVAVITVAEEGSTGVGDTVRLDGSASSSDSGGDVVEYRWTVVAPDGSEAVLVPSSTSEAPSFVPDVAGTYSVELEVTNESGTVSCHAAQVIVVVEPVPAVAPAAGCADDTREGFLDEARYTHIAACAGAWDQPGITPAAVQPTCGRAAGDDGQRADGAGCSSADLCAAGWHVCDTWREVARKSPDGCAGAVPPNTPSKSLFFAVRQPSANGSVCGEEGDGVNDVFGCGNLGAGLGPDKGCGPLDRVLASTQPNSCGFNEAEPPLGPWECRGGPGSDLEEGATVTKTACAGASCSYDGRPVTSTDKGGVLCCRD